MLKVIKKAANTMKTTRWEKEHRVYLDFRKVVQKANFEKDNSPLALYITFQSLCCFESVSPYIHYHFRKIDKEPEYKEMVGLHDHCGYFHAIGTSNKINVSDKKTSCFLEDLGRFYYEFPYCFNTLENIELLSCSLNNNCAIIHEVTTKFNIKYLFIRADYTAGAVKYKNKTYTLMTDHFTWITV